MDKTQPGAATASTVQPSDIQLRFRAGSARRFGALDDYVNEKIRDGFPICGNLWLATYVSHYLEFLFKRYCIANLLTSEEKLALEGSDTILANYLCNPALSYEWLKEARLTMAFERLNDLDRPSQFKQISEFEKAIEKERIFYDAKQRILESRDGFYQQVPKIALMDVGPAIGAITTLFALKVLDEYGLLERTCITLVDVSEEVLKRNIGLDFPEPDPTLISAFFGTHDHYEHLKQYLGSAKPIHTAADDNLPLPDDSIDVALASFLFHHIPHENAAKKTAADNILRVTKGGIFVADEYFDDYKAEFAAGHKEDKIPLAPEEPVPFIESLKLFPEANFREAENMQKKFYAFWILKYPSSSYGKMNANPTSALDSTNS